MAATPAEQALLAHVVAQMESNIEFLVQQNYITAIDASAIRAKLPKTNGAIARASSSGSVPIASTTSTRSVPQTPTATVVKAKATWGYNEDGSEPKDLSFSAGEIIEIVAETNEDWWTGKHRGKTGLFPSNYVVKIAESALPARNLPPVRAYSGPAPPIVLHAPPAPPYESGQVGAPREKAPYKPFGAALHGSDLPPSAGTPQTNSVGLQEAPGQDKKKSKYGALGNTMAHSAAGGAGFAVGSGLVRAIF
ncbi:SH3-domain-containing protein [Punctularia strigosozonata HHB-11173 SS5]|uniref:SH3-domain-containing protein n=1 Tax=Punctularia strigosozonata (strain HHB-11173) TaxID=741275 RepID=R7S534_PUNST|nr:SH3-domain-containing protein [Punctularia strigosozonata HHB-11173 SS5]EIN05024.1 SH3-domain-containing protein [Punctularia strigosozonata HHB-11173 SS5]